MADINFSIRFTDEDGCPISSLKAVEIKEQEMINFVRKSVLLWPGNDGWVYGHFSMNIFDYIDVVISVSGEEFRTTLRDGDSKSYTI